PSALPPPVPAFSSRARSLIAARSSWVNPLDGAAAAVLAGCCDRLVAGLLCATAPPLPCLPGRAGCYEAPGRRFAQHRRTETGQEPRGKSSARLRIVPE